MVDTGGLIGASIAPEIRELDSSYLQRIAGRRSESVQPLSCFARGAQAHKLQMRVLCADDFGILAMPGMGGDGPEKE